ncbi:MAG: hypothetical protein AMXMBFR7_32620 [Planctomycetota bacterium]
MSARDEVLDRLLTSQERRQREQRLGIHGAHAHAHAAPASVAVSPAVDAGDREGLIVRFAERLQTVGGTALRAPGMDEARAEIGKLLERWQIKGVAVSLDPLVRELDLGAVLEPRGVKIQVLDGGASERIWREELSAAAQAGREPNAPWDLAIGGCAGAIAETGSIAHLTSAGHGRGGWLLCQGQLVVLTAEQIVPDLEGLFVSGGALDRTTLPRAVTLVTGPSRTADIEQTLTIGVHGPGRYCALVVG